VLELSEKRKKLTDALQWSANTPRVIFTLAWVLAVACGGAVLVLGSWHLFMVMRGETSIESHDNGFLEKKAKEEGLVRTPKPNSDSHPDLPQPL
jgi:palmitoyltransferase